MHSSDVEVLVAKVVSHDVSIVASRKTGWDESNR